MRIAAAAMAFALTAASAPAADYSIETVPDAMRVAPADLKRRVIAFTERRGGGETGVGLPRYLEWMSQRPLQARALSLFPGYGEGVAAEPDGAVKSRESLYVYVVEARFALDKPAASLDLSRYATLPFLEKADPAIKSRLIKPAEALPAADADYAMNRNPERPWCEGREGAICIQSHYRFEGKLPTGILLANKLTDTAKRIPDFVEFQSELRPLGAAELGERPDLAQLTNIDAPFAGGLEQSIFYVNQILQFGKFLAVVQPHPADPARSVATVQMALAVKSSVFDRKREYEGVPILRNLVPAQVLMGNSSFNTGSSISAGLPAYIRTRVRAVAAMLSD